MQIERLERLAELERYRPIRYGTLKLLAGITFTLLVLAPMIAAAIIGGGLLVHGTSVPRDAHLTATVLVVGIIEFAGIFAVVFLSFSRLLSGDQWPFTWLRTYRSRNHVGEDAVCWYEDNALRVGIDRGWSGNGIVQQPNADGHTYAILPLGETRRRRKLRGAIYSVGRLGAIGRGWTVALERIAVEDNNIIVRLTDPERTSFACGLQQAFTIIRIVDALTPQAHGAAIIPSLVLGIIGFGPKAITLAKVLAHLDGTRRLAESEAMKFDAELKNAKVALQRKDDELRQGQYARNRLEDECRQRRDAHIGTLVDTIEWLTASKRFIRSIEALNIKRWAAEMLLKLLPEDDRRRPRYEREFADAQAVIAARQTARAKASTPPA